MPETTEAPETSTETTGANYPTPPVASTETTGANYPTPPVASTETTFSHEVQSAVPEEGVFVFDPLHEAEMLREIIKGVEIRARDFSNRMKAYTGEIFDQTFWFSFVIEAIKENNRIFARTWWNGKQQIQLQVSTEHSKMTLPYIYMTTEQGDEVPWVASHTDMLAEDWYEVE